MADYFVRRGERIVGPFQASQLRQLASTGKLSSTDMVRQGEIGKWYPASTVQGLFYEGKTHPQSEVPDSVPSDASAINVNPSSQATVADDPSISVNARFGRRAAKRTAAFFGASEPFQRKHLYRITSTLIVVALLIVGVSVQVSRVNKGALEARRQRWEEMMRPRIDTYLEKRKQMAKWQAALNDTGILDQSRMDSLEKVMGEAISSLQMDNTGLRIQIVRFCEEKGDVVLPNARQLTIPGRSFTYEEFRVVLRKDCIAFQKIDGSEYWDVDDP